MKKLIVRLIAWMLLILIIVSFGIVVIKKDTCEKTEEKVVIEPEITVTEVFIPTEEIATVVNTKKTKSTSNKVSKIYKNCPLSAKLQKHIDAKCKKYKLSTDVVIALIESESNFKVNIMGDSGRSYGLMQIQKRYQTNRMKKLKVTNLLDAYGNTTVGIDYLAEIYKSCKNNWNKTLMVYNGGWGYAKRKFNRGEYSTKYSRKILQRSEYYKSIRK